MIHRKNWKIRITEHAYIQADLRDITADMVSATIKTGKIKEFGKNIVKFINEYKDGTLICVGVKKGGNTIKIVTVEWR